MNERKEIENLTETVREIEIKKLTRDDGEHNDDNREKMPDDKQWRRQGEDGRWESGGDEMKILRKWGRGWGSVDKGFVGVR